MEPVTVKEWFLLLLLFAIPIVNVIVLIVFATGNAKPSLVNYSRAIFLWFAVGLGLALLIGVVTALLGG